MHFTAQQIAAIINAQIEGDATATVHDFAKIEEGRSGAISFLANSKYLPYLYTCTSSVIIINESLKLEQPVSATLLRVPDAYQAFAVLMEHYNKLITAGNIKKGVEQPVYISSSARLGSDIYVGAFAYIGDNVVIGNYTRIYPGAYIGDGVTIGDHTVIYAGVRIYQQCNLGNKVIIHAGAVIGADGFGFAPQEDGSYKKIPQIGNVIIEDEVEIGAGTTIDRATMGATIIRKGVKLDNLIQIAHNVEIGEGTVIAAQTGISGSTKIGRHCMIGGQVGIVGHIQIADGTRINAQSGVAKSITQPNQVLNGSPAFDYHATLKSQAVFRKLPQLQQEVDSLKKMINISQTDSNKE